MKLKLNQIVGRISEGNHKGVIRKQTISSDRKYQWFQIEVNGVEETLNISVPFDSIIFNQFAQAFCDENGEIDTEDFVDVEIEFTVSDKSINGVVYSKFQSLQALMEEE